MRLEVVVVAVARRGSGQGLYSHVAFNDPDDNVAA